jgi:hypothetical protein
MATILPSYILQKRELCVGEDSSAHQTSELYNEWT